MELFRTESATVALPVTFALLLCSAARAIQPEPDRDGDGIADAFDECSNTPPEIVVNEFGRPVGDLDGDCDADLSDFHLFSGSFTGPLPPADLELCDDGLDNDDDQLIDCADVEDCPIGAMCGEAVHCSQFQECGCPVGLGDCDGNPGNGCELNLNENPVCGPDAHFLGFVSGDTGADVRQVVASTEGWYRVTITEDNDLELYLGATVELESAPGTNYNLVLRCASCGNAPVQASGSTGAFDYVYPRWEDDWLGEDDTLDIIVEVRWASGGCGGYTLTVYGNTDIGGRPNTCDP